MSIEVGARGLPEGSTERYCAILGLGIIGSASVILTITGVAQVIGYQPPLNGFIPPQRDFSRQTPYEQNLGVTAIVVGVIAISYVGCMLPRFCAQR